MVVYDRRHFGEVIVVPERDLKMRMPSPELLPGSWDYVLLPSLANGYEFLDVALAVVREPEGYTWILPSDQILAEGTRRDGPFAAIRLNLQTSLHEHGITAGVSKVWAENGIPCNVIAGFYHDVFLCPWDRREEAIQLISDLSF